MATVMTKRRAQARASVTKFLKELEKEREEGITEEDAEVFLEQLALRQCKLQELNESMREYIEDTELEKELEDIERYDDAIAKWTVILRRIKDGSSRANATEQGPNESTLNISSKSGVGVTLKLPKFDMPKFEGDILKWPSFWAAFSSAVHEKPELCVVDKFNYLRSVLVGSALKCIESLPITEANYDIALERLKGRFGQKRVIINGMTSALLRLPAPRNETRSLRQFLDEIESKVTGLRALGVDMNACSPLLVPTLSGVLPEGMRSRWIRHGLNKKEGKEGGKERVKEEDIEAGSEDLEKLIEFLRQELEIRELASPLVSGPDKTPPKFRKPKGEGTESIRSTTSALNVTAGSSAYKREQPKDKVRRCLICNSDQHLVANCTVGSVEERLAKLKQARRCFNCFWLYHDARSCPKERARCGKCRGAHHSALCPQLDQNSSQPTENKAQPDLQEASGNVASSTVSANSVTGCGNEVVLLKSAIVIVDGPKGQVKARLILDDGSQKSFISQRVTERIGAVPTGMEKMEVAVFSQGLTRQRSFRKFRICLFDHTGSNSVKVDLLEVDNPCSRYSLIPQQFIKREMDRHKLLMADPGPQIASDFDGVDILIGSDLYWSVLTGSVMRLTDRLVAMESVFGWVVQGAAASGGLDTGVVVSTVSSMHVCADPAYSSEKLRKEVERFWQLESLGIQGDRVESPLIKSALEKQTQQEMEKVDGHYRIRLPWTERKLEVDQNYKEALRRFFGTVRRLSKEEVKIQEYHQAVMGYLANDHAELVDTTEGSIGPEYYIPHLAVFRSEHDTTKLRIVFDASSGHPSLNECLHAGPHLAPDLLDLLLNFRRHEIAITADLEKAFLQIEVDERDRDALRFVWLPSGWQPGDPTIPVIYRMKRVPFGLNCGPFLLAATLRHHFGTITNVDPGIMACLEANVYVDDLVTSVSSIQTGRELFVKGKLILADAGFNMRKWATNSAELREDFAKVDIGPDKHKERTDQEFVKVLGVTWNQWKDQLTFDMSQLISFLEEKQTTKRTILQAMARIYDPFGLLTPFTIRIKILFQELWKAKIDWDDDPSPFLVNQWKKWVTELPVIGKIDVQRCVIPATTHDTKGTCELYAYSDASEKAYGAAVYLVHTDGDGKRKGILVASKARVAPMKGIMTIPRLELMGALISARLVNTIQKAWGETSLPVTYFTDSMVTLHWIKGEPSKWKQFVGNRVREIQDLTGGNEWRFIPGEDNPADKLTRGSSADSLAIDSVWWTGLSESRYEQMEGFEEHAHDPPVQELVSQEIKASESLVTVVTGSGNIIDPTRYSSWKMVVRVVAWMMRFIHKALGRSTERGNLQADEISRAEVLLIRNSQMQTYAKEYNALLEKQPIERQSKIYRFDPTMGRDGLLRLGGRLRFSMLDDSVKHPVILDGDSWITKLIIMDCHERTLHGGVPETLVELRERFWVPAARSKVKRILRLCLVCARMRAKPITIVEAPLPPHRIETSVPFENIGLDYAGPLHLRDGGGGLIKAYVLLITCAVSRAIHLELVRSLSADDFLMAFRRFVGRRGMCRAIWSDNAQTFKRAKKDLSTWSKIEGFASQRGISWNFIVEKSPWWGGIWERLVRSVKTKLKAVCGRAMLAFDEMQTILVEIEGMINSRPLGYVSDDAKEVITPAHLLIGRRVSALPPASNLACTVGGKESIGKMWRHRMSLLDKYWKAWKNEYLLILRSFHERRNVDRKISVQTGQVVLLSEEKTPRHLWKTCIVKEVTVGRDGQIRSALVQTPEGQLIRRPVQLLCPLELVN